MVKGLTKVPRKSVENPDDKKKLIAKKTAGSIQKKKTKSEDVDELKQLLKLEPPKINLDMFNAMSMDTSTPKVVKKKPNSRQRAMLRLVRNPERATQINKDCKNLVQR